MNTDTVNSQARWFTETSMSTTETKHTPVPWAVSETNDRQIVSPSRPGFRSKSFRVADAHYSSQLANTARFEEAKANAELIVRAVNSHFELLAVLKKIDDENGRHFHIDADIAADLRAAISKAEGHQP